MYDIVRKFSSGKKVNLNLTEVTSFFPDFDLRIMASETFRADSPVRLENGGFFVNVIAHFDT